MTRRKSIPLKAQLEAALRQLGFEPHEVELDHDPALARRPYDEVAGDTVPPASDPRYLVWRHKDEHRRKTFGNGATTRGSDVGEIAKTRRLEKDAVKFRAALLRKEGGEPRQMGRIRSPGFRPAPPQRSASRPLSKPLPERMT